MFINLILLSLHIFFILMYTCGLTVVIKWTCYVICYVLSGTFPKLWTLTNFATGSLSSQRVVNLAQQMWTLSVINCRDRNDGQFITLSIQLCMYVHVHIQHNAREEAQHASLKRTMGAIRAKWWIFMNINNFVSTRVLIEVIKWKTDAKIPENKKRGSYTDICSVTASGQFSWVHFSSCGVNVALRRPHCTNNLSRAPRTSHAGSGYKRWVQQPSADVDPFIF